MEQSLWKFLEMMLKANRFLFGVIPVLLGYVEILCCMFHSYLKQGQQGWGLMTQKSKIPRSIPQLLYGLFQFLPSHFITISLRQDLPSTQRRWRKITVLPRCDTCHIPGISAVMSKKKRGSWSTASHSKVDDQANRATELEALLSNEKKVPKFDWLL